MLTRDAALAETLKGLGADHNIVTVDAETDLAGELVGNHNMGAAIIDAGAVTGAIEQLTETLKSQFPELVLIVAGSGTDQTALAAQITSGTVYRFLHKPVSEQRVRLFVDAAWRRRGEELSAAPDSTATVGALPDERAALPRNLLFTGAAVVIALLAAGGWLLRAAPTPAPVANTVSTNERDEQLESLLTRADAAMAAGALVAPPGQNAVELYKQALRRNGGDPRPAAGIEAVINKLLSAAEDQLGTQHLDAAQKLVDQARSIKPDHLRVTFLNTRIGKERERFVLNQARQAASSGNIRAAIAALDAAGKDQQAPAQASDTQLAATLRATEPQELEQKALDERVSGYLAKAAERLRDGQLVEPAQDNARFFIESARAVAPDQPQVLQAQKDLQDKLSLLFNQRLAQGKVLDPPNDNAKFYAAQLIQADAAHPSTVLARQALANRTLDEAKAALQRQDYVGAQRWLSEARDAGMDDASMSTVEHDMTVAQDNAKRAAEVVPAATLELAKYVPPSFPASARQRGVSGWVDVQLLVKEDGSVSDVVITGAEPVGIFEQAAVDAVKEWRYKPVEREGHAVDQRARLRMKFALDQ